MLKDNVNGRTIRGFSTQAREKMYLCENCPDDDFKKFINYYGEFDYAEQWIQAALDGTLTNFDNGNADFRKYASPGKSGKKSSSLLKNCGTRQRLMRSILFCRGH